MGWPATCYHTYLGPPPPCKQALRLCLHYTGSLFVTTWKVIWYSMNSNCRELEQVVHTHQTSVWLTSISVGFRSSLLLIYFHYGSNTCSHCDEEGQKCIRYMTIHFQDWHGEALFHYKNWADITHCYVWTCGFSCRRQDLSGIVWT